MKFHSVCCLKLDVGDTDYREAEGNCVLRGECLIELYYVVVVVDKTLCIYHTYTTVTSLYSPTSNEVLISSHH